MVIRAKYKDGVFTPLEEISLAEGSVVEFYLPSANGQRPSLKSLAFAGIWKDRPEMRDSVAYVNRLRAQSRA